MTSASAAVPKTDFSDESLRDAITALAGSASIETSAKNVTEVDAYAGLLPAGTAVYVTWLPGLPYQHIVSVASRLRRIGYRPVPHVAARRLADAESARDFFERLAGEAAVEEVLLIAGDADRPAGPYPSALELLRTGLLQEHGIRSVGIAGYPEGHPKISNDELAAAMAQKIAAAQAAGLNLHIVSQFCFDGSAILRWLERLHASGVISPVRVGLAGPASVRTLLNFGVRCGVGSSLRALRSYGVSLTRLVAPSGPERLVLFLADAVAAQRSRSPFHLHFFSFGGFEKTAHWIATAASGDFHLDFSNRDFRLRGAENR